MDYQVKLHGTPSGLCEDHSETGGTHTKPSAKLSALNNAWLGCLVGVEVVLAHVHYSQTPVCFAGSSGAPLPPHQM